ncbi:MAG TPA: HEAT repeat domain-containing protein [Thermoanaerobaculia bacterium]|nr:HEAT repeat domain-containing protein [Thermoanaerobaculia bacterium]
MTDIPRESPRNILFQFVLFPLGIVLVAVGVFFLFGKLATETHSIPDYLNAIRSGSSHERWQAAYQLSKSLKRGEAARYPNLEQQVAAIYEQSKNDDPRIRRYLSMVLGSLGDRRATPLLLDGLSDRDPDNRIYVLMALGELKDPISIPHIVQTTRESDKDVRKTAYFTLGEIGNPYGVPALVDGLTDEVAEVRWNAAISLSRFNDRRAVPVLREMLDRSRLSEVRDMREDQKEDVMIMAMAPLVRLAGPEARVDLQRVAATDPSLRVRAAAKSLLR